MSLENLPELNMIFNECGSFLKIHPSLPYIIVITIALVSSLFLLRNYIHFKRAIIAFKNNFNNNESFNASNFLEKHFNEIKIKSSPNNQNIVCKTEPVAFLEKNIIKKFKESISYKLGQNFVGISLMLTFILIGQAVYDIGNSLSESAPLTKIDHTKKIDNQRNTNGISTVDESPAASASIKKLGTSISNLTSIRTYL